MTNRKNVERPAFLPRHVANTYQHLANTLVDGVSPHLRRDPVLFAAEHLGIPSERVFTASENPDGFGFLLASRALAKRLGAPATLEMVGGSEGAHPQWDVLKLADVVEIVPSSVTAPLPVTVDHPPFVASIHRERFKQYVQIFADLQYAEAASAYLAALLEDARGPLNPFRQQTVRTHWSIMEGLSLEIIDPPESTRETLVLSCEAWEELDLNVLRTLEVADRLIEVGLGGNRGVLLVGPPGTGKTAISRVYASELAGRVTVLMCDVSAAVNDIDGVYRAVADLAPALVIVEDIDMIAARRGSSRDASALQKFLVALDGVMTSQAGVVTIASTNDRAALDEAAQRAARFDVVVDVPPPAVEARRRILATYLAGVEHDIHIEEAADMTDGATGADLRELVKRAVIETGEPVSHDEFKTLVGSGRWRKSATGMYL